MTVVVIDNAAPADVERLVQQVVRTAPKHVDIAVASLRALRLAPQLARRVRRLRGTTPDEMNQAVLAEATAPRLVLVASSTGRLTSGWLEEVAQRATIYKDVTSAVEASSGGFVLYPPAVTSASAQGIPWFQLKHLSARGRSAAEAATTSISAVLIVKDEELVLDACLTAAAPFVDEIVVYDTGSTDSTKDIARSHGVTLVEGYWDEHFGNARNRALEHATCEWIVQIDADEVMEGDPAEFRARLAMEAANQLHLKIVSSSWQGGSSGLETLPVRIFRRGTAEWVGALHEYPMPHDVSGHLLSPVPAPALLIHSGYQLSMVQDRNKTTRNVDLSRAELDATQEGTYERAERLSNYIRSLLWAARAEEALPYFDELLATEGNPTAICVAGRTAPSVMLQAGRPDDAWAWVDKLEAAAESPGNLAVMRARIHLHLGDSAAAREAIAPFLDGSDGGRDTWGQAFDAAILDLVLADAALADGQREEALERYFALAPLSSGLLDLNTVLSLCVTLGRPIGDLAELAPEELLARSVREAASYHPSGALRWFEACVSAHPDDVRFVVAGNLFAARSDWRQALTWAVRAREWGLDDGCALRGLGENTGMPHMERVMAWLLLAEVLGEADAPERVRELLAEVPDIDVEVLRGVAELHGLGTELLARDIALPAVPPTAAPVPTA